MGRPVEPWVRGEVRCLRQRVRRKRRNVRRGRKGEWRSRSGGEDEVGPKVLCGAELARSWPTLEVEGLGAWRVRGGVELFEQGGPGGGHEGVQREGGIERGWRRGGERGGGGERVAVISWR